MPWGIFFSFPFLCNPLFVYFFFSVFSGGLELLDLAGYAYDDVFYKVLYKLGGQKCYCGNLSGGGGVAFLKLYWVS